MLSPIAEDRTHIHTIKINNDTVGWANPVSAIHRCSPLEAFGDLA